MKVEKVASGLWNSPVFRCERERRFKSLAISPELLLNALFSPLLIGDEVRALKVEGLPEFCEVESVVYSEYRNAFLFRLYSPSFEPLRAQDAIPELEVTVSEHRVRVQPSETIIEGKRISERDMRSYL